MGREGKRLPDDRVAITVGGTQKQVKTQRVRVRVRRAVRKCAVPILGTHCTNWALHMRGTLQPRIAGRAAVRTAGTARQCGGGLPGYAWLGRAPAAPRRSAPVGGEGGVCHPLENLAQPGKPDPYQKHNIPNCDPCILIPLFNPKCLR